MSDRKPDKRVQRTRHALCDALVCLMTEKGYREVTVQNILDRTGISRSTFYTHFRDKEDLLTSSLDNLEDGLTHQWKRAIAVGEKSRGELSFALPFLRHVDCHRALWAAVSDDEGKQIIDSQLRSMLENLLRRDLAGRIASGGGLTSETLEATMPLVVGGLMSLLTSWMEGQIRLTPAEMNLLFVRYTLAGLSAIA